MSGYSWSFLIVAGGSGTRLGGVPKQFRRLGGKPVWLWSADVADELYSSGRLAELVLVVPAEYIQEFTDIKELKVPFRVAEGGRTRSESVMNGLRVCSGSHVLVHDAARPFISMELCTALMHEAEKTGSAVPLLPVADSLKKHSQHGFACVDRQEYFRTQTPQAFDKSKLISAINDFGLEGTDEAAAWLAAGGKLGTLPGEEGNFKITTPFDWNTAVAITETAAERRTGHGYDVHKLVPGRKLILAGVEINDSPLGLLGHSDADIVVHTVMDAILGAAGEPDIGTIFPASDDKWKDAASTAMLAQVLTLVRSKGWRVEWVDVTLEAQTPRLGHLVGAFEENMSVLLRERHGANNFNMKVKSGEGCGSVGRAECMVCHGVATLSRINNNLTEEN